MSTGVPVTDRGFDSSISRGNLRTNSFYNRADHLHTGGNLRGIPMPMRRSLTVLNSTRYLTMGRGQIIDNVGQQSPPASPSGIENDCMDKGQVIDNTGQRSPCVSLYDIDDECLIGGQIIDNFGQRSHHTTPFSIDNDCMDRGQVIDNAGQQSPCVTPYDIDDMYMARGQVIDNAGQRPPRTESNSRIPEIGVASNSIDFSQSVTQILATLGKEGYINPREGLAVISAYTDT